jgi:hypothetical protein
MVEKTKTLDINELLAQAERVRAATAAATQKAKEAAEAAKIDTRNKEAARGFNVSATRLVPQLNELKNQITREVALVSAGARKPASLKSLVDKYNKLVNEQADLIKKSTDISSGVLTVDSKGKLISTGKATGTQSANNVPFGSRPFETPMSVSGQVLTPDVAVADAEQSVVTDNQGNKVVDNKGGNKDTYAGSGTKNKPLTKNGSPFTGTYNGKKYNNGILATATAEEGTGLTTAQESTLGTYGSKYLLEYFKANYPTIYNDLIKFAKANELPGNVEGYLRNTAWYKDVNQRVNATVGGYALSNGITLTKEEETSFRDKLLAKVVDKDEVQYQIRLKSIEKYQLETVKPDIARAMKAGLDFDRAAADYIQTYTKNFNMAASQFSVNDPLFQQLLTKSTNLADFEKGIRKTDKYLSQPQVQQQINSNKLMVQTKYRQYGLSITDEAATNLAKNVFLGDSSNEQIDENLRQQAVAAFPAFRDRILNGESPLAIASPYIQAMVRILEIPEGGIDLEDPTIRKAMQGKAITDAKGTATSYETVPLWMFEQSLFKDNRWQFTSNARGKADTITLQLKDMLGL